MDESLSLHIINPLAQHQICEKSMSADEISDDVRITEIQSLQLIFEGATLDEESLTGLISIDIKENWTVTDGTSSHEVTYFPPIQMSFTLPDGYPDSKPPEIHLSCPIFTESQLEQFHHTLVSIWQDYRDQIMYSCVDYLQHQVQYKLGEVLDRPLKLTSDEFYQVVAFNDAAERKRFESSVFECGICQDNRIGLKCTKFDCSHVFCNHCLNEYFTSTIEAGEVEKVRCPDMDCTKKWTDLTTKERNFDELLNSNLDIHAFVNDIIKPAIPLTMLSSILNSPNVVHRYQSLRRKHLYEMISRLLPNALIECPRVGCEEQILRQDRNDLLVQCPKCNYAFCFNCRKLWHAKYVTCKPVEGGKYGVPISDIETYLISEKDSHERKVFHSRYGHTVMRRAVKEYEMDQLFTKLIENSPDCSQCPSCEIVIQKSDGCNLMTCAHCDTKFCFLCGFITGASHDHFADPTSTCYRKLFHGMPGVADLDDTLDIH